MKNTLWKVYGMANNTIGKYALCNNEPVLLENFDAKLTKKFPGIYEVVRIIDGVPLFLEDHIKRFRSSAKILGHELKESDEMFEASLKKLIDLNGCIIGNVQLVVNGFDKTNYGTYMFFIGYRYPSQQEIKNGVPVILYHAERNNPNAKTTDLAFRNGLNAELARSGAYEALMVNKNDEITEGSKSNVFFVSAPKIYTSPLVNVLPGVTRAKVIYICKGLGLEIVESTIKVSFLKKIDGLFITGTSPEVLPISSVNGIKYDSQTNQVITSIRKSYEKLVEDYVKSHK